jgi:hypothetical protein
VNERAFLQSVYALVEAIAEMELSDTSRHLILAYIQDAEGPDLSSRARSAISRYLQAELPGAEEIRGRRKVGALTRLDELMLEMERCAASVR